jgi:hypothetical protein
MADLELQLRELGAQIEYPPTPDIAGAVRARLAAEPSQRPFGLRRAVVIAVAVLAVAVAAVMAVPQARTAILEWLGLRGVTIERVSTQPTAPAEAELGLGDRVSLDGARSRAAYEVLVPQTDEFGDPGVYYSSLVQGGQVGFVYRSDDGRVVLLITEFRGSLEEDFIHKSAGPETTIERVTVNGEPGFWLEGEPHEFLYLDEAGQPIFETLRLAGNTLLWTQGEVTLRLEGDVTKAEALAVAESMR